MIYKITIASVLIVFLVIVLSLKAIRNKLTFYPDRVSEMSIPASVEYISERQVQTSDGEVLHALLFKHEGIKRPLIIYFHGNSGNLYGRAHYAQQLYEMNYDVLLVSYRGYSKSTGTPSEKGIYRDGEAGVNYAIDTLGVSEKDISIIGRSLGTTVAIDVSQGRDFNAVVLITPLTSGKDMAAAMGLGWIKVLAGNSFNAREKINNIKSKLLIVHGDRDELTPYFMGQELMGLFAGNKKMITIKGGDHNNLQDVDPQLFWDGIEDFLK
jgi:fermentation-respiration switch protein FrsA (DUF1100 family)